MKFKKIGLSALLFLSMATNAMSWRVLDNEGEDVFGVSSFEATDLNGDTAFNVRCDSGDLLNFAMLMKVDPSSLEEVGDKEVPATLLMKFSDGKTEKLDATLRAWNANYLAAVVSGKTPELIKVLGYIRDAKASVKMGVEAGESAKVSATMGISGSTKVMNQAIEVCKLKSP